MSARVEPGGILPVRTYWRRLAPQAASPDAPRIFLASYLLLDPRDAPASQTAAFLGSLANPVHLWPESLEVRTTYRLIVPEGLEPGRYTLALRLYEWDGRRVALAECDDPEMAAHYMLCRLAKIEVAARRR